MPPTADARTRLLDAALTLVRTQGFAATSVDALCRAAGVTKGALFHHFRSKEELGAAAAEHWAARTAPLFSAAPYHALGDPLARVLGYIAFRKTLLGPDLADCTCYAGTTVQETYATHPAIRDACAETIVSHALTLEQDLAALISAKGTPGVTARGLALHIQAVVQGALLLAKAMDDPDVAAESFDHLYRYVELLFTSEEETVP
jgi:TetR/AcrR family transcriptional repressor of nem operon